MNKHKDLTQSYSTWGDKLLQHTDVLYSIQKDKIFKPITIQISLTETCESDCPFCSVAARPIKHYMPFEVLTQVLNDFKKLGAKSVEFTGGGNPLLYKRLNDAIKLAYSLDYKIGIITNSYSFKKSLNPDLYYMIDWIRVSLIQLEEGRDPEDYDFNGFPTEKLGLSYIIYEDRGGVDELSRTGRTYKGTTIETIERIHKLLVLHSEIKFVRIAGDCLKKGANAKVKRDWKDIIEHIDQYGKIFIKDIDNEDSPFNDGCYVGLIRPYVAPGETGYKVYICSSHVLNTRTYDEEYALCRVRDIIPTWKALNKHYAENNYPYEVKGNLGCNWATTCKFCFYKPNNKLLHTVANEMPDKDFP